MPKMMVFGKNEGRYVNKEIPTCRTGPENNRYLTLNGLCERHPPLVPPDAFIPIPIVHAKTIRSGSTPHSCSVVPTTRMLSYWQPFLFPISYIQPNTKANIPIIESRKLAMKCIVKAGNILLLR